MSLREDILEVLTDDTALMALLTGGIHSATEISREITPAAFDANKELLPCALLKMEPDAPFGPYVTSSQHFFSLMVYQRIGYDVIDAALLAIYALLHQQRFGNGVWLILWQDDTNDARDEALNASLAVGRYAAVRKRA